MRSLSSSRFLALVGSCLFLMAAPRVGRGDELADSHARPRRGGLLSRLFTDLSATAARDRSPGNPPATAPTSPPPTSPDPAGRAFLPPDPAPPEPAGPAPRLIPQPRVSRPVTEADPILTRVAIGRSDTGARFGLFLEVFADGTVLDSEGIHRVDRESLRPLIQAIQAADPARLKGHCGGPPTDFVEQVHVVAFERTLRGLRANAFSYSGNPQGCDPAVRNLHAVIDAFQARLTGSGEGPAVAPGPAPVPAASSPPATGSDAAPPPPLVPVAPAISLVLPTP